MKRYDIHLFGVGYLFPESKHKKVIDTDVEYQEDGSGYWVKASDVMKLEGYKERYLTLIQKIAELSKSYYEYESELKESTPDGAAAYGVAADDIDTLLKDIEQL